MMKIRVSELKKLIREALWRVSAPKKYNLPEEEVEADDSREAGKKGSEIFAQKRGVKGIDPFSISVEPMIAAGMKTRTLRNPSNYDIVTDWGFTHVPWPEFVKRFPQEARDFIGGVDYGHDYIEGWSDEDIERAGGEDPLTWDALWDDEVFLDREGNPVILGNITGPGGSTWYAPTRDGYWDEILFDDDGNREELDFD